MQAGITSLQQVLMPIDFRSVTGALRGWGGTAGALQGHCRGTTELLQEQYRYILGALQGNYRYITEALQGC